jgi:hypothetical protein
MVVKIPPPQFSIHRRAALTTNSNGTQPAHKGKGGGGLDNLLWSMSCLVWSQISQKLSLIVKVLSGLDRHWHCVQKFSRKCEKENFRLSPNDNWILTVIHICPSYCFKMLCNLEKWHCMRHAWGITVKFCEIFRFSENPFSHGFYIFAKTEKAFSFQP